jgi:hypothetical protein
LGASANVLFTEDVGGSEILYLDIDGTGFSTVLGSESESLAQVRSGRVEVSVEAPSLVLFDPSTSARVGQGVHNG